MKTFVTRLAEPLILYLGKRREKRRLPDPPIYIGGCSRSGTTLLLSVLSAHPEIAAIPRELNLFEDAAVRNGTLEMPYFYRLYRELLRMNLKPGTRRYCEKSPSNIHNIREIEMLHQGRFRFINIVRDGRDVILSRHPRNKHAYWVEPDQWIRDVEKGKEISAHDAVLTIRYEDLTGNYEKTIRNICRFLDLPVTDEILHWHTHTTVRKNRALHSQIKQINSKSVGKWKKERYADRVAELTNNQKAVSLLSEYGYKP